MPRVSRRLSRAGAVICALGLMAVAVGCAARPPCPPAAPAPPPSHYVDADDNSLERYDPVWQLLAGFFGDAMPPRIRVEYLPGGTSRFDPEHDRVQLSLSSLKRSGPRCVVAHESSHLALARLTRQASTRDPLRFIDEGLASVLQARCQGDPAAFRQRALGVAATRLAEGRVSFALVDRWSEYFGRSDQPDRLDFDAYLVGASFVLYALETLGEATVRRLLVDLGRTGDLAASVTAVLQRPPAELERGWLAWLGRVPVPAVPRIVALSPPHLARGVRRELPVVEVTFDTDMQPDICVSTDCRGVCYRDAYWKGPRTLAIRTVPPLPAGHRYELSLGVAGRCALRSVGGRPLPVTPWVFETE
jgi:hypothetical protein